MADGKDGRPKLPALNAGSRHMVTGTYLAEQISTLSYDLVSAVASLNRNQIGKAGAISPSDRTSPCCSPRDRRKKTSEKIVKCTQLPALENIDTIFVENNDRSEKVTADCASNAFSRLGKNSETPCGDDDDDDVEFKGWLTLPRIGQTPVRGGSRWHLLLSHKTFSSHTEEHVSACLMHVLGLEQPKAHAKIKESRRQRFVLLEEVADKGDAFRKLQKFRSLGLQVQVTLDCGLPGDTNKRLHSRASQQKVSSKAQMRSYTEVFYRAGGSNGTGGSAAWGSGTAGSNVGRMLHVEPTVHHYKKQDGLAHWRSAQTGFQEQPVLPEDPVADLFQQERQSDTQRNDQGKGSLLRGVIGKCHKELQEKAHRERVTADQFLQVVEEASRRNEAHQSQHPGIPEHGKPKELSLAKKDASMLMRFLMFGYIGNEDLKEKDAIFYETIGTKEQVWAFQHTWGRLDGDASGRVDWAEFTVFVEKMVREKLEHLDVVELEHLKKLRRPPVLEKKATAKRLMHHSNTVILRPQCVNDLLAQALDDTGKFTHAFCEKVSVALMGKKSSFAIEDMMRVLWLSTTPSEMRIMKSWCREMVEEAIRDRVKTPPVLETADFEALCCVFEHFDEDRQGEILLNTLVAKGLIYNDQIEEIRKQWDQDGNGLMSIEEFCDMMCPFGYRSTAKSEVGSQADGKRVYFDHLLGCWKLQDDAPPEAQVSGNDERIPKELHKVSDVDELLA